MAFPKSSEIEQQILVGEKKKLISFLYLHIPILKKNHPFLPLVANVMETMDFGLIL